jgi:outer membrane protein assembly factor BamB
MKNYFCIMLFLLLSYSSCLDELKNQFISGSSTTTPQVNDSNRSHVVDTNRIKIIVGTFLGNETRNFSGDEAPSHLNEIWRLYLGSGQTRIGAEIQEWSGAGWTGQPLVFLEDSIPYLIQGAYDHHLRKINALTGEVIWQYEFDDIIKSTGTIWINKNAKTFEEKYVVMQGSRQGVFTSWYDILMPSYRAISLVTGKELWRLSSRRTDTFSRDVDGSSLVLNDTAYIGLENGTFVAFNPDKNFCENKDGMLQPEFYQELMLYENKDILTHGGDLVTESSPSKLGDHIYITAGSGHIYGYNLKTKAIDWDFFTGSDINGSPAVTNDSCLIVAIEKQFIYGRGGTLKLDPSKPADQSVIWFYPTEDKVIAEWLGGIIGSASINDFYNKNDSFPDMAAFIGTDGFLYVVDHKSIDPDKQLIGFDNTTRYNTPKLLFKYDVGPTISTPVFVKNKLIACTYTGMYLFECNTKGEFELLDHKATNAIESTPVAFNKRIYIASRDGYLYCYGDDSISEVASIYPDNSKNILPDASQKKSETITKPTSTYNKEKFYLIAGSFAIKANAETFLSKLMSDGYSAEIIAPDFSRNMVSIGTFDTKEDAIKMQSVLSEKGMDTWVY